MKRKLLNRTFMNTAALAVPAAALMLGAAQAGTTIGLNFQAWYYDSGATPQTIGFGAGYQTTGVPVTTKAFGVEVVDWANPDPLPCTAFSQEVPFGGGLTAKVTAANMWQSGYTAPGMWGTSEGPWSAAVWPDGTNVLALIQPGDYEVTWGMVDNTGWSIDLTGMAAKFPNGYVLQLIGSAKTTANSRVAVTNLADGASLGEVSFTVLPDAMGLGATPVLTANALQLYNDSRDVSTRNCAVGGLILTDKPVVSRKPVGGDVNQGSAINLSAGAIGIGPLSYQWRLNGTPIPNATNTTYSVAAAGAADAGNYDLVVTNLYGAGTSVVATVNVLQAPSIVKDLTGVTGTVYSGGVFSQWSIVAGGGEPLSYTWFRNGTVPVGANSPTLILNPLAAADSGNYSVTVTNAYGSARSATNHLVVVASPNAYATVVAQDAPAGYWPLNESSGTDVLDYSGVGHIGTNNAGTTQGVAGPRPPAYAGFDAGKVCYQFDGTSGYVDFGTGPSLAGTGDFTLEAWVKTTDTAVGVVLQQRDPNGYNGEYVLSVNAGAVSFMVYGGGYQFNFSSSKKVNDGLWHHIAAVRAGTNGTIYIDGSAAASQTSATIAPLDATIKTYIGADVRTPANYFNGQICDVAIYRTALSASRIGLHAYTGQLGTSQVVLKIVSGGYVADTKPSGTLHPGLNYGAAWVPTVTDSAPTPITRTGVETFTGASQIAIPAAPDLSSPSGTIMFWLQANAPIPGPGNEGAMLVDHRTTVGGVIVLNDGGAIFWQGQGGSRNSLAAGYVPDNNWHHIAVTYGQTTSDSISIYIDGVLAGSTPVTNAWTWPTNQQIEIGASHDAYWKKLNGNLDDFRMYNRVLTDTEINQVFTSGALVDANATVLRYNFDTAGAGLSLSWSAGPLLSSPTLGPTAVWTPVPNAASPYPFLPPPPSVPTNSALFYRVAF